MILVLHCADKNTTHEFSCWIVSNIGWSPVHSADSAKMRQNKNKLRWGQSDLHKIMIAETAGCC